MEKIMEESSDTFQIGPSLSVSDRVRRKDRFGSRGTIQEIRAESTISSASEQNRGLLVSVLWDNGTLSYFSPESLERVDGK